MGARRTARELALQMLFQQDLSGNSSERILDTFEDYLRAKETVRRFARRLFVGAWEKKDDIDSMIADQAEHWRVSRMAAVDRNIIRMAVFEMLHEKDAPPLVVIDEAVELAKRFGSDRSSQFVNGVLDGIMKKSGLPSGKK
ncbi:MAG: transcription antitermination factor NusB [Acidobacteria bacterium]|nr:transcription antitermination factor NusB [Acidobacteriota bacterium]